MSTLAIGLWIGSVLLDTTGRLAFKQAAVSGTASGIWQRWKQMLRSRALWVGIVCFVLEFVVWLALLSLIPLSQAILIGSINIVAVALAGRVFFRERLDAARVTGIALIAVGVALAGSFG
jgi:drug/metabolite transporter (DMT)-like permease